MATNVSISELKKEKETFQDVLPNVIQSIVTIPKLLEVPEFSIWMKKVWKIVIVFSLICTYLLLQTGINIKLLPCFLNRMILKLIIIKRIIF